MVRKSPSFTAFYVAHGGENLYLDRYVDQARQSRRRVVLLDGLGLSDVALVDLCESTTEEPRIVILDNAQLLEGEAELTRYVERRNPRDQSVVLVAIVRAERLTELWSLVASKGKRLEWPRIKRWKKDTYLDFIREEATRNQITIREDAAQCLLECAGPDLYRLANEVRKLAIYGMAAGEITKRAVEDVATCTAHADPAEVAQAALAKDPQRALALFAAVCAASGESRYGAVVYQLMRHVESAMVARSLFDEGVVPADAAARLGQNAWWFTETVAPLARKHDLRSLVRHMGALAQLDADVKTSRPFKRTMIELVMLSMAQ